LRKRALIEGIGNIAFGVTLALGGVYGGAINQAIGWKWAFLVQPPIIVLDAALVILVVRIPPRKTESSSLRRIDYFGVSTLMVAIILLQLALHSGGGEQLEQPTCDCIVHHCCYQLWIVLVLGLGKASSPIIPIRAILERTVASAQLNFLLSSAANVTIIFYIPIYLQVLGISTGESGIRFIPMAVCLALSSFATGYLVEATGRYHYINILVQISSVTGSALLCSTTQVTPAWAPFVYFGLLGWVLGAPMLLDL